MLWLLLSGLFYPHLLAFGLISVALVVWIALRMDVVDQEGHPVHLRAKPLAGYWLWLLKEIVKSNLDVSRRILHPRLPISPTVVRLKCSQRTDLGRVIYANSLTLTPGTVSINVEDGCIEAHALTREGAESLKRGEMDARVSELESP